MKQILARSRFLLGFIVASFFFSATAIAVSENSVDLNGLTFTWPATLLAPQSFADEDKFAVEIKFKNNSTTDFYYVGYSSNDPSGTPFIAFDSKFGVKAGTSGTMMIKLKMLSFLNFTGPATYGLTLCANTSRIEKETCTKGSVVIINPIAKAAADKILSDAKAVADKILSDAKAVTDAKVQAVADAKAAAKKKTTITCIKGKLTKKVTAVKPKCPAGYKKK
jgi:cell division septum initiation protein DivIVA